MCICTSIFLALQIIVTEHLYIVIVIFRIENKLKWYKYVHKVLIIFEIIRQFSTKAYILG